MSSTAKSLQHAPAAKVVPLNVQTKVPDSVETRSPAPPAASGPSRLSRLALVTKRRALDVLPPLLAIGAIVGLWELLCAAPDATLPPPSRVVSETWELIVDPFYDRGGIDKGLFWHVYASLKRVALGYLLASIAGVALGVLVGSS